MLPLLTLLISKFNTTSNDQDDRETNDEERDAISNERTPPGKCPDHFDLFRIIFPRKDQVKQKKNIDQLNEYFRVRFHLAECFIQWRDSMLTRTNTTKELNQQNTR